VRLLACNSEHAQSLPGHSFVRSQCRAAAL
jgi:hypothetical protein